MTEESIYRELVGFLEATDEFTKPELARVLLDAYDLRKRVSPKISLQDALNVSLKELRSRP